MTSYHSKSVKNVVLEQVLTFSSEAATKLDKQNKPENFATRFDPVITLPNNLSYKVGLVKMNATYSWHNIEATANNNTVRYSPDAGLTFKTITFPDGVYSYTDIDSFIKNVMKDNGWSMVLILFTLAFSLAAVLFWSQSVYKIICSLISTHKRFLILSALMFKYSL